MSLLWSRKKPFDPTVKGYQVLYASTIAELERQTRLAVEAGWRVSGNMTFDGELYCQPVVQ